MKANFLIVITLTLIISSVYTIICTDGAACGSTETCCYDSRGLSGCCGYTNAVCCSDGLHCCPQGTTCDLAKGRCTNGGLPAFMTKEIVVKKVLSSTNSNKVSDFSITPEQRIDLLNGFLEGSDLKKFVPDVSDCAANMTTVYNSVIQAVNDFSKAEVAFEDIAHGIQMIGVAIQGLSNATLSCKNLNGTFGEIIVYAKKIAANPGNWFKLISASATKNSFYILWDLYGLDSLIQANKYKDLGIKLGEIFKYIFDVDLASNAIVSFFKSEQKLGIDINKVINCSLTVFNVAQKAIPIVEDIISHPENIFTLITQISAFYKELESACNGVFNVKIVQKFVQKFVSNYYLSTKNLGKIPSVDSIITCVKTIKPFATDVYNAISSYQKGDTDAALKAVEQGTVDLISLGMGCYQVIKDIISD